MCERERERERGGETVDSVVLLEIYFIDISCPEQEKHTY